MYINFNGKLTLHMGCGFPELIPVYSIALNTFYFTVSLPILSSANHLLIVGDQDELVS